MAEKTPDTEFKESAHDAARESVRFGAYGTTEEPRVTVNGTAAENLNPFAHPEKADKKPFSATPEGRAVIRMFSRGVMGASFFAAGQIIAGKALNEYDPTKPKGILQGIVWLVDKVITTPMFHSIKLATGREDWARKAVSFRHTRIYHDDYSLGTRINSRGRSLGEEVVAITFDFAMASIGDALGRNLVDMVDPNVKKTWYVDGHFKPREAAKALGKSVWTIFSYNQGEDWAVSIPYAFYLRLQRNVLEKIFPGFKYDSDRALNGGSFKVNDKGNIVGDYQLAGMIDFQGRFTVYNMFTSMYRDIYRKVGAHFDKMVHPEKHIEAHLEKHGPEAIMPPERPASGIFGKVQDTGRWFMRHVIKAGIYMTPSVPFFWATRVPQSKQFGMAIHPEKGPLGFVVTNADGTIARDSQGRIKLENGFADHSYIQNNNLGQPGDNRHNNNTPAFFVRDIEPLNSAARTMADINHLRVDNKPFADQNGKPFAPFTEYHSPNSVITNPVGKANQAAVKGFNQATAPLGDLLNLSAPQRERMRTFGAKFVRASASYTPYMYMKNEMNLLYGDNNAQMDMAADRLTNGVFGLNWSEAKAGAQEIWHTIKRQPLVEPARASELSQRREANPKDTSPRSPEEQKAAPKYATVNHTPIFAQALPQMRSAPKSFVEKHQERLQEAPKLEQQGQGWRSTLSGHTPISSFSARLQGDEQKGAITLH